jgi:hypothetical protein
MSSQDPTLADRSQRHRRGLKAELREIKASVEDLRRDFQLAIIQRQIAAGLPSRERAQDGAERPLMPELTVRTAKPRDIWLDKGRHQFTERYIPLADRWKAREVHVTDCTQQGRGI